MTRRRLGIAGLLLLMIAIGVWVLLPKHRSASASVDRGPGAAIPVHALNVPGSSAAAKPTEKSGVWTRPPAKVVTRNQRRVRFAPLKRLGASDEMVNRLTDGDVAAVVGDLKRRAQRGDAAAGNMLHQLIRFNCGFASINGEGSPSQTQQLVDAQALSTSDAEWLMTAIQEKNTADRQLFAACQSIDKNEVMGWITHSADQGNGASLMLLSLPGGGANSRTLLQRRLQEAVQAGNPEAEAFLAQGIVNGVSNPPAGASANVVGTLLEEAAKELPYAESELAVCEFMGCPGIEADISSAVAHAREAAQRGSFDAMIEIGPRLQASGIDPNEVQAWNLVGAMLAQQGCSGGGLSVQNMTSWTSTLSSKATSDKAKSLAEDYWRDYGMQMMSNIGCGP